MKKMICFLFLCASFGVHAQGVLLCGYDNFTTIPGDYIVSSPDVDFDENNNEVVVEMTVVETQFDGDGIDPISATFIFGFAEAGVFSCSREFMPVFGCVTFQTSINYIPVSANALSAGVPVQVGDLFIATLVHSGNTGCSGTYEFTLSDFLLEIDCLSGCTYWNATNFNPSAVVDDGSCEFPVCSVTADLDGDGTVGITDLVLFLAQFGL